MFVFCVRYVETTFFPLYLSNNVLPFFYSQSIMRRVSIALPENARQTAGRLPGVRVQGINSIYLVLLNILYLVYNDIPLSTACTGDSYWCTATSTVVLLQSFWDYTTYHTYHTDDACCRIHMMHRIQLIQIMHRIQMMHRIRLVHRIQFICIGYRWCTGYRRCR